MHIQFLRCSQRKVDLESDREMVGGVSVTDDVRVLGMQRALEEYPVERTDQNVGPFVALSEATLVACIVQALDHARVAAERIQIAGDHDWSIGRVLACVGEHFLDLTPSQFVVATAFEVKIVNHQLVAAVVELGHLRDSSSLAALEKRKLGDHEGIWLPETG